MLRPCVSEWETIPIWPYSIIGETGADMEYIGADGHYGLGRVMICEENQPEPEMTVLSW